MQAILSKIIPATNCKPTRIKASCARGSITISADNLPGRTDENHTLVASKLIAKFCAEDLKNYGTTIATNPWNHPLVTGQLPNGDYAHVFSDALPLEEKKSEWEAARVKTDVNGNSRYAVHFLAFLTDEDNEKIDALPGFNVSAKYERALARARRVGGKKFHNKQFGGGIVFQAYGQAEIDKLIIQARKIVF